MPKIRIDVNKLENPTADYISLVSRGANRIPFRIIKAHPQDKEQSMIDIGGKLDLNDIRAVLKSDGKPAAPAAAELTQPVLVGIVIEKGDHLDDDLKKDLTEAGINTENMVENEDETVTFVQGDGAVPEEAVVLKASDHMLALYASLDAEKIVKGTPYEDLYEESGFLLSPELAATSLTDSIKKADEDAELDATAKATLIAEQSAANAEYVKRITPVVGEVVVKANEIVQKACKAKRKQKEDAQAALDAQEAARKAEAELVDCPACDGAKCNVCDTGKVTKAEAETISKAFNFKKKKPAPASADAAPAAAAPAAAAPAEGESMEDEDKNKATCAKGDGSQEAAPAATVAPMDAAALQAVLTEALAPIQKSISDLAAEVVTVKQAQEKQGTEVAGMKEAVTKAEKVLKTTLIGGAPSADREEVVVVKQEGDLGNLDTAYNPAARRVQKGFGARVQEVNRISRR